MRVFKRIAAGFNARFPEDESGKPMILFGVLLAIVALLCATLILVFFVNRMNRLVLYAGYIGGLLAIVLVALCILLSGRYKISAYLTIFCITVGPWGSVLLDPSVLNGDIVPLVYLVLSIQLCSILLSVRATVISATTQLAFLIILVRSDQSLQSVNWPSLYAFIVFSATLGIVTSQTTRKQIEKIEEQRNQLKKNESLLRSHSVRDSLTGLFNRFYMEETLDREAGRAVRYNKRMGIIMGDIDHFKNVNDTYGHACGDAVLSKVAELMKAQFRMSDVVCRYGGDEFIIILSDCTIDEAQKRAENMRFVVEKTSFVFENRSVGKITMSFGIASLPECGSTREQVLRAADQALYAAKNEGRNRVVAACFDLPPTVA
jgi:diguanylate cyclase (GGDEF)-like protein